MTAAKTRLIKSRPEIRPAAYSRLARWLRVVWAITAKDLWDALKNKTTLSVLFSMFFLMAFYRLLPNLTGSARPAYLFIYDAGRSSLLPALETGGKFEIRSMASLDQLWRRVRDGEVSELGLVIPADYDALAAGGGAPEVQAYLPHWVSAQAAAALQQSVEAHILKQTGVPARIRLEGSRLYLQPDSKGYNVMPSWGIIMCLLMIGINFVPHLMLEEKRTRTLDALLVSPAGPAQVMAAKALTGLVYGLAAAGLWFALYTHLFVQWPLALLAAAGGALFSVAVGLLLGTLISNRQQLALYSWSLALPLFLPLAFVLMDDLFPAWVVSVARLLPAVAVFEILCVAASDQTAFGLWAPWLGLLLLWTAPVLAAVVWLVRRSDR